MYHKDLIAGCLSGAIEVSVTHPIDNLKVHIQNAQLSGFKGLNNSFKIANMYQGYIPRIMGVMPMRTVFWSAQSFSNSWLEKYNMNKGAKHLVAGWFSGTVQTLVDCPIESLKTRQITNKGITKELKLRTLFKGFTPTAIRNAQFCAVFNYTLHKFNLDSGHKRFLAGGFAGVTSSVLSHPFDVVKTEMQKIDSKTARSIDFLIDTIKKRPRVLWSGLITRSILGCCTMSVSYFSFSLFMDIIKD